jgi:cyclic pyranopterin phosphate synthase
MIEQISHLNEQGNLQMVDVGDKPDTDRIAIARGEISMQLPTLEKILANLVKKGDVLAVAQIAGIMAAKRTAELIPLCHTLPLHNIQVDLTPDVTLPGIRIEAKVRTNAKTGVEMEVLTAVAIAALAVYDMVKAIDKTMRIQNIRLVEKHGGKSADFQVLE